MRTRSRRWLIVIPIVLFAILAGGYVYMISSGSVNVQEASTLPVPKGDGEPPLYERPPSEERLMQDIHQMAHQKILAKQKWGALQITQNRIDEMHAQAVAGDYEHKDTYLGILEKWKAGDFSESVKAHNAVWKLQGGTIGKAKRLLTTEEELKYIRSEFGNKFADVYETVDKNPGG